MQNKNDTDRLASELLAALQNVLNKPLPGAGQPKPQTQADDTSLFETIKDFLTQSLPGTKPAQEDQPQPVQPAPVWQPAPSAQTPFPDTVDEEFEPESDEQEGNEEWFVLKKRQTQEREDMQRRHELEREAMHRRHEEEREGMRDQFESGKEEAKQKREREREARKQEQERGKRGRGHGRGRG